MPGNPEKIKHLARVKIDDIISNILPKLVAGLHIADLQRQITLMYPVSPNMVKNYVLDCYVEPGRVLISDSNMLTSVKEEAL